MDRKSIIGLILIFLVFMGYMWWTAPTEEELAAQRARRDSIMRAEQMRIDSLERAQNLSLTQENTLESQLQSANDSIRLAALAMVRVTGASVMVSSYVMGASLSKVSRAASGHCRERCSSVVPP